MRSQVQWGGGPSGGVPTHAQHRLQRPEAKGRPAEGRRTRHALGRRPLPAVRRRQPFYLLLKGHGSRPQPPPPPGKSSGVPLAFVGPKKLQKLGRSGLAKTERRSSPEPGRICRRM